MDSVIIPAIIPQSLRDLRLQLEKLHFAPVIQIDVVDGRFVSATSWPYKGEVPHFDLTEPITGREVGVDLMVSDPLTAAEQWLAVGATRLVVHVESLTDGVWPKIVSLKDTYTFELALAANNDTPLTPIIDRIQTIDYVQLMGITQVGSQGQAFDDRVLKRITDIVTQFPDLPVSIDGSVNFNTIERLHEAGAKRFVVGSAILRAEDPEFAYQRLQQLITD